MSWAVSGSHQDLKYDVINVMPLLAKESILVSITTENDEIKKIAEVAFPAKEQTEETYLHLIKQVIRKRLHVLL
jgi:hypothetical protein